MGEPFNGDNNGEVVCSNLLDCFFVLLINTLHVNFLLSFSARGRNDGVSSVGNCKANMNTGCFLCDRQTRFPLPNDESMLLMTRGWHLLHS